MRHLISSATLFLFTLSACMENTGTTHEESKKEAADLGEDRQQPPTIAFEMVSSDNDLDGFAVLKAHLKCKNEQIDEITSTPEVSGSKIKILFTPKTSLEAEECHTKVTTPLANITKKNFRFDLEAEDGNAILFTSDYATVENGLLKLKLRRVYKRLKKTADDNGSDEPSPQGSFAGFAAENGGTTGGKGGRTITVSDASSFLSAIKDRKPLIIKVAGTINIKGMHQVSSDKSIIGVDDLGIIDGGGLTIENAKNIIIQNLLFRKSNQDAINVEGSTNILISHNDLQNAFDGLIDIKKKSDFITVSWNHFTNHNKTCLLSSDDAHSFDKDYLRVTYHHNFFDGTDGRHPRVRFSRMTHVYNNYYRDNNYGVASTLNAHALVEGNYFENVKYPLLTTQGTSGTGLIQHENNVFASGSKTNAKNTKVNKPSYSYQIHDAKQVPSIIEKYAGRKGYKNYMATQN